MKDTIFKVCTTLGIIVFIVLVLFIIPNSTSKKTSDETTTTSMDRKSEYMSGKHHVLIKVKGLGEITVELDADTAPITVTNFIKLVDNKFYDGLTFHRIIDGFMIQGGDPSGTGFGGSETKIKGEFAANGVKNDLKHERGVISMARGSYDYNSASSQFFIVQTTYPSLDGQYAAFGKVTKGIEIVDEICKNTPVEDNNGKVLKENQPIIEKIYIVE